MLTDLNGSRTDKVGETVVRAVIGIGQAGTDQISGFHLALSILGGLPVGPPRIGSPLGHLHRPSRGRHVLARGEG
jgi:hypothetical protein